MHLNLEEVRRRPPQVKTEHLALYVLAQDAQCQNDADILSLGFEQLGSTT